MALNISHGLTFDLDAIPHPHPCIDLRHAHLHKKFPQLDLRYAHPHKYFLQFRSEECTPAQILSTIRLDACTPAQVFPMIRIKHAHLEKDFPPLNLRQAHRVTVCDCRLPGTSTLSVQLYLPALAVGHDLTRPVM